MALDLSWVGTMVIVRVGYVRPVRLVHLRTNSGNKNYESREFGTTNAHESTRIKKRWSTKNTKDTKKNRVHPFVSFRAFRGQKIRVDAWLKPYPSLPAHKIRKQNSSTLSTRPGQNFGLQAMFPFNTRRGNQRRQNAGVRSTSKVKISRRPSNMAKQRIHLAGSCRSA